MTNQSNQRERIKLVVKLFMWFICISAIAMSIVVKMDIILIALCSFIFILDTYIHIRILDKIN